MTPLVSALLLLAALLPAMPAPAVAGAANQCVACHRTEDLPIALGHSFAEWKASPHGRAGVGCERCHGGDATAGVADRAHAGMKPAADPESAVSDRRLPHTCGACHAQEEKAFEESGHGKTLAAGGKGATCRICHGTMATSLPSPAELDQRCAACHQKPVEAQAALAVMTATKRSLVRAHRAVRGLRRAAAATRTQLAGREHDLERNYTDLVRAWHTFRPKEVLTTSRDLLRLAEALTQEAAILERRAAPPAPKP